MFALIESAQDQKPRGGWTGRFGSLVAHAAFVAGAVLATSGGKAAEPEIRIVDPTSWPASPQPRPKTAPAMAAPGLPQPVLLVTVVPPNLPTLDAPPPPSLPADPYAPFTTSDVPGPADPGAVVTTPIRDLSYVEEPPALLRHPAPRYPEVLRQAGVEGHVVVEVVLDTSGVAEAGSLRVVTSAHQLFDAEARAVVLGSRYRPARAGGRAVRVRIQVPVVFAIRR